MSKPLAAITGASSGIGAVFAERLAARGYDLLLIARREDRLKQMAAKLPGEHQTLVVDLVDSAGLALAADRLRGEERLALLVNNAGFGTKGRFFEAPFEEQQRMNALHVQATLALTHAALKGMVARDRGAIINVSSVAAFSRSPGNTSYCATKSWMNAFTEGLYLDLQSAGSKVKVQALCPGFTFTEFHDVMGVQRGSVPAWLWMRAEGVVDASLRGLDAGRLFVVPGAFYRVFTSFFSRLPSRLRVRLESAAPHSRKRLEQG